MATTQTTDQPLAETPRFHAMDQVTRLYKERNVLEAFAAGATAYEAAFAASTNATWIAMRREADAEFDAACERAIEDSVIEQWPPLLLDPDPHTEEEI